MLPFKFFDASVEDFIYTEVERLQKYLSIIVQHFYDLNWGEWQSDELVLAVDLIVDLPNGMPVQSHPSCRVFSLEFNTVDREHFELYVKEWIKDHDDKVAVAQL